MEWIIEQVKNGIWGFLYDLAGDIMDKAFELMTKLVLESTSIDQYFPVSTLLGYVQVIAVALLVTTVAWEAFKQQSGNILPGQEKTIGQLMGQTIIASFCIGFLPWSIKNIFLKLNDALIVIIQNTKSDISVNKDTFFHYINFAGTWADLGASMILLTLILVIGFFILGIAGGIRYIELIVVMLLAPIVSVSAVRNYDAINVWVRETVAIVFTQAIQLLLLKIMVASMMNLEGVQKILICIAILVVILRGPQVLRTFMYASGTGNAVVGAAGAAGRMQAMKIMMKSIK